MCQFFSQVDERVASNKIRYKISELLETNDIYTRSRTRSADFNDLIEICIFKLQGVETTRQSVPKIQLITRVASNKIRYKISESSQVNGIYTSSKARAAEFNHLIKISIFKLQGLET